MIFLSSDNKKHVGIFSTVLITGNCGNADKQKNENHITAILCSLRRKNIDIESNTIIVARNEFMKFFLF